MMEDKWQDNDEEQLLQKELFFENHKPVILEEVENETIPLSFGEEEQEKMKSKPRNKITIISDKLPEKIRSVSFDELFQNKDEYFLNTLTHSEGPKNSRSKDVWWMDFASPTKEILNFLQSVLGIHHLTVEDILEKDLDEKIQTFDNYYLVTIKELYYEKGSNNLISDIVNILVFNNLVLTFHSPDGQSIEKAFQKIKSSTKMLPTPDWVLYTVLDVITYMLSNYVRAIILEGESLDDLVLIFSAYEQSDLLRRIGTLIFKSN